MSEHSFHNLKRLAVSCGGTGGHFNPGLSIAVSFQEHGGEVRLVLGGRHALEQAEKAAERGIAVQFADCAPVGSKSPVSLARFMVKQLRGIFQCLAFYRAFKPDAVISMGSFASGPAAAAAFLAKIPLFLHDGNARIGKSNRIFSRAAAGMALSFPAVNADKLHCPWEVTGLPLRSNLLHDVPADKAEAIARINSSFGVSFSPEAPTVLVFGGSQGAAAINENFSIPVDDCPAAKKIQVIHLSGPGKFEAIREKYRTLGINALALESSDKMQLLYTAADLVVCRSGGSTVSELALFRRYAVLVPYPYAAELHQDDNAALLEKLGAARVVANKDCSPEVFRSIIRDFLNEPEKFRRAGLNAGKMAVPDAAGNVTSMIDRMLAAAK